MCIKARELLPQTLSTPFGFKEILTQYECNVWWHKKIFQTEDRECETACLGLLHGTQSGDRYVWNNSIMISSMAQMKTMDRNSALLSLRQTWNSHEVTQEWRWGSGIRNQGLLVSDVVRAHILINEYKIDKATSVLQQQIRKEKGGSKVGKVKKGKEIGRERTNWERNEKSNNWV